MDRTIMSTTGLHIRRPPLFPASVYLAVTFIVLYIRAVRRVNHIDTPTARRKNQISAHYHPVSTRIFSKTSLPLMTSTPTGPSIPYGLLAFLTSISRRSVAVIVRRQPMLIQRRHLNDLRLGVPSSHPLLLLLFMLLYPRNHKILIIVIIIQLIRTNPTQSVPRRPKTPPARPGPDRPEHFGGRS